jgi:hypothetical protein
MSTGLNVAGLVSGHRLKQQELEYRQRQDVQQQQDELERIKAQAEETRRTQQAYQEQRTKQDVVLDQYEQAQQTDDELERIFTSQYERQTDIDQAEKGMANLLALREQLSAGMPIETYNKNLHQIKADTDRSKLANRILKQKTSLERRRLNGDIPLNIDGTKRFLQNGEPNWTVEPPGGWYTKDNNGRQVTMGREAIEKQQQYDLDKRDMAIKEKKAESDAKKESTPKVKSVIEYLPEARALSPGEADFAKLLTVARDLQTLDKTGQIPETIMPHVFDQRRRALTENMLAADKAGDPRSAIMWKNKIDKVNLEEQEFKQKQMQEMGGGVPQPQRILGAPQVTEQPTIGAQPAPVIPANPLRPEGQRILGKARRQYINRRVVLV